MPTEPAATAAVENGAESNRNAESGADDGVLTVVGETAEIVAGFGRVRDKLSVERQARIDRGFEFLARVGAAMDREDKIASRQVNEIVDDFAAAGALFFDAVLEPEKFREKLRAAETEEDDARARAAAIAPSAKSPGKAPKPPP